MAQRGDAHHRPGVRDGVPGGRAARAGPRARGRRLRVGRDDPHTREATWRSRRARASRSCSRSAGASCRAASALVIGCQTFPTWNSYPGIFASLATGNPVIVKPHPGAILPLALTVAVAREVLAEQGLDPTSCCSPPTRRGRSSPATSCTIRRSAIIDYTGSTAFGTWVREQRRRRAGLHRGGGRQLVVIAGTADFDGHVRQPRLLARALQRADVHRAAGHLRARAAASRPTRAASPSTRSRPASPRRSTGCWRTRPRRGVCGAIASPATFERIAEARALGTSCATAPRSRPGGGAHRDAADPEGGRGAREAWAEERFGPIAFVVAVRRRGRGHRPRRRHWPASAARSPRRSTPPTRRRSPGRRTPSRQRASTSRST